ncbi:MAG: hypothetical protein AAF252_16075 [Pseudomonadota bacterium]
MQKIGKLTYPDTIEGILSKRSINQLFREFLGTRGGVYMMDFCEAKFNPEVLYKTYLDEEADDALNLPSKMFEAARALRGKWDHPGWAKIVKLARVEMIRLLSSNFQSDFFSSEIFQEYHLQQGGSLADFGVIPEDKGDDNLPPKFVRVAERLGIKNTEALRVYVIELERKGGEKMRAAGEKMLRADGVRIKIETVNEVLFESGVAVRPDIVQPETLGAGGPQVTLHKKALILCGFENLHGQKPMERIQQMVLSMHRKDKKGAEVAYGKLLKEEPKSSFLHNTTILDLMKTMKKRKAFEVLPS